MAGETEAVKGTAALASFGRKYLKKQLLYCTLVSLNSSASRDCDLGCCFLTAAAPGARTLLLVFSAGCEEGRKVNVVLLY